jgi:dTDP-4-dehydrorhamnose 3,5-epimerase-like enzyme
LLPTLGGVSNNKISIDNCLLLDLSKISDPRGNLTFIEAGHQLPFVVQRVYYLYNIPCGSERGGHAHKSLYQLIIAISGSFDLLLDDGKGRKMQYHLDCPDKALYVCPMMWRDIRNFSTGAVCLVLASAPYEEDDYFRDYDDFTAAAKH